MENKMELFGKNAFTDSNLKKRVSKDVFNEFKESQLGLTQLSKESAEVIANAIKDWATKRGATHFCHWFQPLTDLTAEKHDSFIEPDGEDEIIYKFSGKNLIKGESDASSFPNGGLRSTFEARGYTIWDTSSPPFIRENKNSATLYIPTAFISFTGEALDKKVPLLRSMEVINKFALKIVKLFGNTTSKSVFPTLGVEQEYFLVKKEYFKKRDDLLLTGRTLFGAPSPKLQELNDHYYGRIKENVINFMTDLDTELWKLGVTSKTRHNEAAPNQFEIAPLFAKANIATDHNQIIMETIEKTALNHDLVALLHEKPFHGINGSGKHNNWSLSTDDGINLLEPGKAPEKNVQFLLFFMAVIEAVDRFYPLLRATTANATNDNRLGGHEAPPAIISIYLGGNFIEILENISYNRKSITETNSKLSLGVDVLPVLLKDSGDRNRTSPFAFTGNKFEFRMPGSSSTPATTAASINMAVAKVLEEYISILEKSQKNEREKTALEIISKSYKKHKRILFEGNNYSELWQEEAKKRGLVKYDTADEALKVFLDKNIINLATSINCVSKEELHSRYNAYATRYVNQLLIESKTLSEIVTKKIFPASIRYATFLSNSIESLGKYSDMIEEKQLLNDITSNISYLLKENKFLVSKVTSVQNECNLIEQTTLAKEKLVTGINKLREYCDKLEKLVEKSMWPFPTYQDLLFSL